MLAKRGSIENVSDMTIKLEMSKRSCKETLKNSLKKKWIKEWQNMETCKVTRSHLQTPENKVTSTLLRLGRQKIKKVVDLITGHIPGLRHHGSRLGIVNDPTCRLCQEEEERATHIISNCPALEIWRMEWDMQKNLTTKNNIAKKIKSLLDITEIKNILIGMECP